MPFGPCNNTFRETPCDGVVACLAEHFDSQAEYLACLAAANALITGCANDCSTIQADADADALETKTAADLDCNDTLGAATDDCNTTSEGCEINCGDVYDLCTSACPDPGDPASACMLLCFGAEVTCDAGCGTAYLSCLYTATLESITCFNGSASTYAETVAVDLAAADEVRAQLLFDR